MEIVFECGGVTGHRLFEDLRLFAFVQHFGEQPEVVPLGFRVFGQGEEMAADQQWLITLAFGQLEVAAMTFEGAFGQMLAALAVDEAARVIVVFEVGQGVATVFAFQGQARFFEVVVATGGAAGAGFQAQVEALDNRVAGDHAGVLLIGHRGQFREHRLVIAENELVRVGAVLEVEVNAFFLAQALDEVQIRLVVLHAVDAFRIDRTGLEFVGVALDAVLFQHHADDFRHAEVLEDALVDAVREVSQLRAQRHRITGQAFARVTLRGAVDLAMDAAAVRRQLQEGHYSSMIRGAWVDSYLQTQELLGLKEGQGVSSEDEADYKAFEARLQEQMANYRKTMATDEDRSEFALFEKYHDTYMQIQDAVLDLHKRNLEADAIKLFNEKLTPAWYTGRMKLNDIIGENKVVADTAMANIDDAVATAKVSMVISLLVAVLAAGLCGLLLMRAIMAPMNRIVTILDIMRTGDLSSRLNLDRKDEFGAVETGFNDMMTELTSLVSQAQRSSVQVTTSVTEIAATSKQQQATATETAATTTEIGATSREIAATSRDLVRTMTEVSTAADQASVLAGSGQQGLARMEDTMHSVMGAADLVNAKLAILNEKAGNINQVVVTIVKVADQTNLLSLNAAIEAEKAGEYGRGFAVVATEVRRLADQTAVATYDIEQMVREIQSAVSAGVMGMDKFSEEVRRGMSEVQQVGEQLSQIIHQVQALAPRVLMVNEGMQAQATGAEQINHALVQLGDASSQTVESLRQASFAIDELSQVAVGLRSGVSRFKV